MFTETAIRINIDYLYHMTHVDNVLSILKYGLLSHRDAYSRKLNRVNVANPEIIDRRTRKLDGVFRRPLTDYVCLYFNPRNPMLYVQYKNCIQDDIVILGVDKHIICNPNTIFTDGNAAAHETLFYGDLAYLEELPWQVIRSRFWGDFDDGKRKVCAEVLHHGVIRFDDIPVIYCSNRNTHQSMTEMAEYFNNVRAIYEPALFF